MVYYVAHKYGGKEENSKKAIEIVRQLQLNDLDNTYICPVSAFSYLRYNEIGYNEEMELCKDLLMICDKLIVASDISEGVRQEIELAKLCEIPIEYLERD